MNDPSAARGPYGRPTAASPTGRRTVIPQSARHSKPQPQKPAPVFCAEYTCRARAGLRVSWAGKSAGLPILNPAFHLLDHDARLDFSDYDQRKGSEEV